MWRRTPDAHPVRGSQDLTSDVSSSNPRPITDEGIAGARVSPDDKWLLAGRFGYGNRLPRLTEGVLVLVPIVGGNAQKIQGLKPDDDVRGWTADGQLYVEPAADDANTGYQLQKLNPHTGVRTAWRKLGKPTIARSFPGKTNYFARRGNLFL